MRIFFEFLAGQPVVTLLVTFLAIYPLVGSAMSTGGAIAASVRRRPERWYVPDPGALERARQRYPVVSIIIPAHNEEAVVVRAVEGALAIRWPELDVIVVDDASTDGTRAAVAGHVRSGRIRLLHKPDNEGKSMALNDAARICRGDLLMVLDADGVPDVAVLEKMVPRFLAGPRMAAVTGNPRVLNTRTVLSRVQAVEFSSTVGVHRRGDAIWGRLMTFSGLCTLIDRKALLAVGGFAPDMATEDIDLSWRLQLAGRHVVYEPEALFGMQVPETLRAWWRQRVRWVTGLAQVLRRHGPEALRPSHWRMWPLLGQASVSILWAHLVLIVTVVWWVGSFFGADPPGLSGFLGLFASVVLIAAVIQILVGVVLDYQSDPRITRQLPWAAWYPLAYWVLCVFTVVRATVPGYLRPPRSLSTWNLERTES